MPSSSPRRLPGPRRANARRAFAVACLAIVNVAAVASSTRTDDADIAAWRTRTEASREATRAEMLRVRTDVDLAREREERSPIRWKDGHSGFFVTDVEVSPDGEAMLTIGDDGYVQLYDVGTGDHLGTLGRHSNSGVTAAFSPDGSTILIFDANTGRASLWDGVSGQRLADIGGDAPLFTIARFSTDGQSVLTVDVSGALREFDASFGERTVKPEVPTAGAIVAEPAADGRRVLIVDALPGARVVDRATGEVVVRFPARDDAEARGGGWSRDGARVITWASATEHPDRVRVAVWDPAAPEAPLFDGWALAVDAGHAVDPTARRALTVDPDGTIALRDVTSGGVIREVDAPARARGVRVSPDGALYALFLEDDSVELFAAEDGRTIARVQCDQTVGARFSAEGRRLAVRGGNWGGVIRVIDTASGEVVAAGGFPFGTIGDYAFLTGTDRIVMGGEQNHTVFLPEGDAAPDFLATRVRPPTAIAVRPGTEEVGCTTHSIALDPEYVPFFPQATREKFERVNHCVTTFDTRTGEETAALSYWYALVQALAFHPDGSRVLACGESPGLRETQLGQFDLATGERDWSADVDGLAAGIDVSVDGRRVLATVQLPQVVTLHDAADGERLARIEVPYARNTWYVCPAVFHPGGDAFAHAQTTPVGAIAIRASEDGTHLRTLEGHADVVRRLVFSPDGRFLASCGWDGRVVIWETATWEPEDRVLHRDARGAVPARHASFSPEGRFCATVGIEPGVWLVDLDGDLGTRRLEGHSAPVASATFSPDGRTLLTCGEDATVRLWDVETAEEVGRLDGHASGVIEAVYVGDGQRIVTRSEDATVRTWDAATRALLGTRARFANGEWLAFDPSGYYRASAGAADLARVVVGGRSYPLSSYSRYLEKPELVEAALRGEAAPPPGELPAAPSLVLSSPRRGEVLERRIFQLEAQAEDPTGVADVEVTLSGVAVPAAAVEAALERQERGRRVRLSLPLTVPDGETTATVRVRATNRRGVKSQIRSALVTHAPATRDLYFLALGVADYEDDRLDLAYPTKDVDDLVAAFRAQEGAYYSQVHVERLVDGEVTLPTVKRLRDQFLLRATENDTIVVFVAGHGVRTDTNEYWFLTRPATPQDPYEGVDRASLEQLVTWPKLHAKRRLLLIDTCQSGAGVGELRGAAAGTLFDQATIDRLKKESRQGIYILAASADEEFAMEQQGNGLFTRAILDGFASSADTDGDGLVTIEELKDFAKTQVQERSGGRQVPTFPLVEGGENFPIVKVVR